MGQSRVQYTKPSYYCNKVLVGPWVEDRATFSPQNYHHTSTYLTEFVTKPLVRCDLARAWDLKLNSEDSNFVSQIGRHDSPNYFENFSTTYDLSYNHFPKCYKGYIPRTLRFRLETHEPSDDYIPSFGNITNCGLHTYKKTEWACDVSEPRRTLTTLYQDTFVPPVSQDYKFRRWATPLKNTSKMDENNKQSVELLLRGKPTCNVSPPFDLVAVKQERRCNPITWECPPDCSKPC